MIGSRSRHATTAALTLLAATGLATVALADHVPPPFTVEPVPLDIRWGGRMTSVDVSPASDSIWLAASESGGLWRTTDAGLSWTHFDNLPPNRLFDVKYAPNSPGVILVTAQNDFYDIDSGGIWRSFNDGATWYKITGMPPVIPSCHASENEVQARGIAVDPTNNDVYVATDCGVAYSDDAGATWAHVGPLPGSTNNQEHAITVQPGGVVTVCGQDGLHRSSGSIGSGLTFGTAFDPRGSRASGDMCLPGSYHALDGSPVESNVVYVAVRELDDGSNFTSKLYEVIFDASISANRMDTLENNNRPPFVRVGPAVGGAPTEYDVHYGNGLSTLHQKCDSAAGRCGATTASWVGKGMAHPDPSDIAFSPATGCPLVMGNDGGVETSTDCGQSWHSVSLTNNGLNALQIYDVEVQSYGDGMGGHDHTDIYIGTMDNWLWASSDSGATWPHTSNGGEALALEVPRVPPAHDDQLVSYIGCAPCDGATREEHLANRQSVVPPPATSWAPGFDGQLVIEHDAYVMVRDHTVCSTTTSLGCDRKAVCSVDTGTACTDDDDCPEGETCVGGCPAGETCNSVGDFRLHVQEGSGTSWNERVSFTRQPRNHHVQFSGPLSDPVLYMGMANVSGSTGLDRIDNVRTGSSDPVAADVGLTLGTHFQGQGCFDCPKPAYAAHPTDPEILFAVDNFGVLAKSTTGGASPGLPAPGWTRDFTLTSFINAGFEQRKCFPLSNDNVRCEPNIRVVEYDPFDPSRIFIGLEQGGIFYSDDGGNNWEKIPNSEQITSVTAFAFDQITEDVYVSSYGRGLWKLRKIDLMLPAPDVFEPNDETWETAPFNLNTHDHYDPRVAEDRSAVMASRESRGETMTGLTLHDRNDLDRFRVQLVDPRVHVPDLPDGPTPDPMPICGQIRRLTKPRPFYITDEPDTILFSGGVRISTDLPNDDRLEVVGLPSSGTATERYIPCPILGFATGFDFTVGDRSGLGTQRTEFPTYGVTVDWRIDITRISAAARWLTERLEGPRESERVVPIPCAGGIFPDCPSSMGGPVELEIDHPIDPDCTADGPGCRMFHPFWWAQDNLLFELSFSSAVDQAYELRDEVGQRIAAADQANRGGTTFEKVLSVPDLQPGFYVLVVTGPAGPYKISFNEFPKPLDFDGDGVLDVFDDCPTAAEDVDGIRDGDGCPESATDIDGDNLPDVQDNCVDTFDPQGVDSDNDGQGDACDCAINDATAWDPPLMIDDLTFPSKFELQWSPTGGGSGTVYEILRGDLSDLPVSGNGNDVCLVGNFQGTSFQDGAVPQVGGYRYNVRGRNACGASPLGGAHGSAADCSAVSCAHSKCVEGTNLFSGCDTCVEQICAVDPYCCDTAWDSICVGRVLGDCGRMTCADNGSSCQHDVCTVGPALVNGCDSGGNNCVTGVCDLDPYCCDVAWDDLCRSTVETACGASCE